MDFKQFINEESGFNVRIEPQENSHKNQHILTALFYNVPIGELIFSLRHAYDETAHIESVLIKQKYQGHHVAQRLYQEMVNFLKKNYPWVDRIIGDVMSKKVLYVKNSILGNPEYLDDGMEELNLSKALKKLPSKLNIDNEDDPRFDGMKIFTRHKTPRKIEQKNIKTFKPYHTQLDLFR